MGYRKILVWEMWDVQLDAKILCLVDSKSRYVPLKIYLVSVEGSLEQCKNRELFFEILLTIFGLD